MTSKFNRRDLLVKTAALSSGATLISFPRIDTLFGGTFADAEEGDYEGELSSFRDDAVASPGIGMDKSRSKKPVYFAEGTNPSLAACAVAELLFWSDIMMEHAQFLALLLPGNRLSPERRHAQKFQKAFGKFFIALRGQVIRDNEVHELCTKAQALILKLIDFTVSLRLRQESGALHSLVWPTFFAHITREAQHLLALLTALSKGKRTLSHAEVSAFWTEIMSEHLDFIAHLLDPSEKPLIAVAGEQAKHFQTIRLNLHQISLHELSSLAEEAINFKEAAEQGIDAGKIKSIIDPALADHVLREALKFADDLKR